MRRALLRLSPRVRTAVVLRYFDDLSEAETAELMGCSRSTVNNHVTRGLAALRGLLAPRQADHLTPATGRHSERHRDDRASAPPGATWPTT